jgi:hypothetical protein
MRRMFVLLIVALTIYVAQVWAAGECLERDSAVTVQIHDYEHLPSEWLSRAREIVTRVYGKIGVRIEWYGVLRQNTKGSRSATEQKASDGPFAQFTVIILTSQMAARGRIPEGILGYAAVPPDGGMGRIAYVIYDRIREIAAEGRANEVELLGFTMAHETGHLLLGRGSGTATGLMKCHWDRRNIQLLDARKLEFSELQAFRIHNQLKNGSSATTVVATGGSRAAEACDTGPRDDQIGAVQSIPDTDPRTR